LSSDASKESLSIPLSEAGETQGHGPLPHMPALDGMRGFAVLAVVAYHFLPREGANGLFQLASAGWIGVDFFLVLSGFLITSILLLQRGRPRAIRKFYIRRALRLFPLYYFIAALTAVMIAALGLGWSRWQIGYLLYAANYMIILHPGSATIGPLSVLHTWTLALEEQFYFIWPWIVLTGRLDRRHLVRLCAAVILLSPVLRAVLWHFGATEPVLQMNLVTRLDSLLFGAVMALHGLPSRTTSRWIVAASLGFIVLCVWLSHSCSLRVPPMNTLGLTATSALAAGCLALALKPGSWVNRFCILPPLRFFGRYSYGIYLWHFFLGSFWLLGAHALSHAWNLQPAVSGLATFFIALAGSTILALASYWILERPFLQLKDRFEA
jgi:peptidoglycan/LPS O-acetylase OafA/YrhL